MKTIKQLRLLVELFIPAFATLYFLASLVFDLAHWFLGFVVLTDLFVGTILYLGEKTFYSHDGNFDGRMIIRTKDDGSKDYMLELKSFPEDLDEREFITFSVGKVIAD